MRKLSGFFIAVAAFIFLGLAYAQLAHAEEPDCESALAAKLVEIAKGDGNMKILSLQLEITALKLARETVENGAATIEASVRKQQAVLDKLDDQEVRKQLKALYLRYGQTEDQAKIQEAMDKIGETADKAKQATYFKRKLRFKNRDLSAYVYLKAHTEEKPFFDDVDASILWYQSEISEGIEEKSFRGSAAANLQEVSTKVAHLLGVTGSAPKTAAELDQLISEHQMVLGQAFDKIQSDYAEDLKKSCAEMKTCTECAVTDAKNRITDEHRAKAMKKAITAIVVEMQKDAPAREAAIQKVADELKAKGIKVERQPEENTSTAGAGSSTMGASTMGASTMGASTIGATTQGASTMGASTVGASTSGVTVGNITSSSDTTHHDGSSWSFNGADTNHVKTNTVDTTKTNGGDTSRLKTNVVDTNKLKTNVIDTNKLKTNTVDTTKVKLSTDTSKTNTTVVASSLGSNSQALPKVEVANSQVMAQNTQAAFGRVQGGMMDSTPFGTNLLGPAKKLTIPPAIGNCLVAYYSEGSRITFRISAKNMVTVCQASYESPSIMLQNQWDVTRALAACKLGSTGLDAKSVCDKAP